jgi:outer membrane receptor protein involved in Fe transport
MNCTGKIRGALIVGLVLWAGFAAAQQVTTGSIEGTVQDPQGAALAGATVTISSPEGPRPTVADAKGHFRFPYLRPGKYELKATKEGFNSAQRQDIEVRLGSHVPVEVVLSPGVSEKMEVLGTAPVVDLSSATTGATISSSLMSSVPIGRAFSKTLALAPGVVASGIDESNPSINGASGLENTYMVDGVNIGNTGFGSAGSYSIIFKSLGTGVNFDYIQEVQVKTGGYEPEFGGALGGFVNMVTKSGGNEVRGSAYTYYQSSALEAGRRTTDRQNATFDPKGFESRDVGFEIGGPVVKNKLFWFTAFDPTSTTQKRETPGVLQGPQGFDHKVDVHRTIYNYAANLKWLVNPQHTLSFSAFGDPARGENGPQREEAVAVADPTTRFSALRFGGNNVIGRWEGELHSNWFAEASIAYHHDKFDEDPDPRGNLPNGTDASHAGQPPLRYGGFGNYNRYDSRNTQYQLKLSDFFHAAGDHNVRYGVDFQDIGYDMTWVKTGPAGLLMPDGGVSSTGFDWVISADSIPTFALSTLSGPTTNRAKSRYLALFASDSWSLTKSLNLMAGVRYEEQKLIGRNVSHQFKDNWAPRLHLTWDPTNDGRSKLSFAFGRFFGKIPSDLTARALSGQVGQNSYYVVYPLSSVDLSNPNNPRITGPATTCNCPFGPATWIDPIDPNAKLTYEDEFVVGGEREVVPFLNLGISFLHRKLGRTLEDVQLNALSAIIDTTVAGHQPFGNYYITNPRPELGSPTPTRRYNAVTVKAESRLHRGMQLLGSYTWSRLEGNYEGYYRRDNGQDDPFITTLFDFPYLKDPDFYKYLIAGGVLPNDRTHVFNLFGSYTLRPDLNLGLSMKVQSGVPKTKLGFEPTYGNYEVPLEPRGASGRTPTTSEIGVHADYALRLGQGSRKLELIANVFNLFDQQKATDYERAYELWGSVHLPDRFKQFINECPDCLNPDFGKATTFQPPRQIQFAVRSSF